MKPIKRKKFVIMGIVSIVLLLLTGHAMAQIGGTFTATGSMTTPRYYHTATLLTNGKVLIAGGVSESGEYLSSAELYDPDTGTFTSTGSMNTERVNHTATLLTNGKVLIVGSTWSSGWYCSGPTGFNSAEIYDPDTGTFTPTGSIVTDYCYPLFDHGATLLTSGKVLIAGPFGFPAAESAWIYDPNTGTFTVTGSMAYDDNFDHTVTLLNTGQVLVAGGYWGAAGAYSNTAELYDPITGIFSPTGNLNCPRWGMKASLLKDGQVLIGDGPSPISSVCAELYDPSTGTFIRTGDLITGRILHTATLLKNGKVLVAGGQSSSTWITPSVVLSSAEIYTPPEETLSLGPGNFWIGLKNSDDQGTQFDLKLQLYVNGTLVAEGQDLCITGVTRNPSYAKQIPVPFGPVSNGAYNPGDALSLKVSTRIGTTPDGQKCAGPGGSHNNAVGLRLYYDGATRASAFGAQIAPDPLETYFLHSSGSSYFLDDAMPSGSEKYKDSAGINFNKGNQWQEIGTWSMTLP